MNIPILPSVHREFGLTCGPTDFLERTVHAQCLQLQITFRLCLHTVSYPVSDCWSLT